MKSENNQINRRDFLKLSGFSLAALIFPPIFQLKEETCVRSQVNIQGMPNKQSWTFDIPNLSTDDKVLVYRVPVQILSIASSAGQSYPGGASISKDKRRGDWVEIRDVPEMGIHRTTQLKLEWANAIKQNSITQATQIELPNLDNGGNKPGETYVFALTASEDKFGWQMFLTPNFTLNGVPENRGGDLGYPTTMKLIY